MDDGQKINFDGFPSQPRRSLVEYLKEATRRHEERRKDNAISQLYQRYLQRYHQESYDQAGPYREHSNPTDFNDSISSLLTQLSSRTMCQGSRYWYNCPCPNPECPRRQRCELSKTLDQGHVRCIQVDPTAWDRCDDWHRQQPPHIAQNPYQNPMGLCENFVEPDSWHNYLTTEPMVDDCVDEVAALSQAPAGTLRYGDPRVAVPFSLYPTRMQAISMVQATVNMEAKRELDEAEAQRREAALKFGREMREQGRQEYLRQQQERADSAAYIQATRSSLITMGQGITNRADRSVQLQPGARTYRHNFDGSIGARIWSAPGPADSSSTQALTPVNGIVRHHRPSQFGYVGQEREARQRLQNQGGQDLQGGEM